MHLQKKNALFVRHILLLQQHWVHWIQNELHDTHLVGGMRATQALPTAMTFLLFSGAPLYMLFWQAISQSVEILGQI